MLSSSTISPAILESLHHQIINGHAQAKMEDTPKFSNIFELCFSNLISFLFSEPDYDTFQKSSVFHDFEKIKSISQSVFK